MIYTSDIIKGLSEAIELAFGSPPTTKDIRKGFERPCTYLDMVSLSVGREALLQHSSYAFELIYFSEDSRKGYIDLLKAQKKMQELFANPIRISDTFLIYAEEVEFDFDRDEMFIVCQFEIEIFQKINDFADDSSDENMEVLSINGERSE